MCTPVASATASRWPSGAKAASPSPVTRLFCAFASGRTARVLPVSPSHNINVPLAGPPVPVTQAYAARAHGGKFQPGASQPLQ